MPKLRKTSDGYSFKCPGCGDHHDVRTEGTNAVWTFNGNVESPTFSPSLLITCGHYVMRGADGRCWCTYNAEQVAKGKPPAPVVCYRCHSFVRDGRIQFLGDCTHKHAGQTLELSEIE